MVITKIDILYMPIHETKYDAIADADSNSPFTLPPPFEMMQLKLGHVHISDTFRGIEGVEIICIDF